MKIFDLPVQRPVATLMMLAALTVIGAVAFHRLPLEFLPQIQEPRVRVTVPLPGGHPREVLEHVVKPIEEEVALIPDVVGITSTSRPGEASVVAEFERGRDKDLHEVQVREAVERARPEFPDGIGWYRVESFLEGPGRGAILRCRLSSQRDLANSWSLLDHHVLRPLERVAGVARVELSGVEAPQVEVGFDPHALRRHGVDPRTLRQALTAANTDADLGVARDGARLHRVRFLGRFRALEQIEGLGLEGDGIRVGDIARVSQRSPDVAYERRLDGEFAVGIDVFKTSKANTVATVDRVRARLDRIAEDPRLDDVELLVWDDAAAQIRNSLWSLLEAGLLGGVLAVAVLFLFLRRLGTTAIVAIAIPFSVLVTCGALYALGGELNVLTLLGMMFGIGMLLDNAVVVMESIHRCRAQGLSAAVAARRGTGRVGLAVTAATATSVVVWSWLLIVPPSSITLFLSHVALAICLAIVASLLISVTFIPLAAARWLSGAASRESYVVERLVPAYRRLLAWTLRHRLGTLLVLLLLTASAVIPILGLDKSGFPRLQRSYVEVNYEVASPRTKEAMRQLVEEVEAHLASRRDELGYAHLYSWFHHVQGTALTRLYLPPQQATETELARIRELLHASLPRLPGVRVVVGDQEWWRWPAEEGTRLPVALHGEDADHLEELALELESVLAALPGVREAVGPGRRGGNEVRVLVDPEQARALGTSPQQVAEAVSLSFQGSVLRRFYGSEDEVEMILGLPDDLQPGLSTLTSLPIHRAGAEPVPLAVVAELSLGRSEREIRREGRRTTTWLSVDFSPEIGNQEAQRIVASRMDRFPLPDGYSWDWGTWGQRREENLRTMALGVAVSLVVVFLLMAALFESTSHALAIVITLPMAFVGSFWLLSLTGHRLDATAFTGIIVLIGIVVNNGIVMMDQVQRLRRSGQERVAALLDGCADRLRPVLMTAITTIVGLLPLALSTSTVATAYIDSLAVAVIGGLASSTVFTLLALPVWSTTLEDLGIVALRALPRRAPAPAPPPGQRP